MWRRALFSIGGLLLATIAIGNVMQRRVGGDDWTRFDRKNFPASEILSGDRLCIRETSGLQVNVQLIGVVALESNQPWAEEAKQALFDRVSGRTVLLRLPSLQPRTPDGVLRAYLYLPDSAVSVNDLLVADGHVYADRRITHAMHKQFEQAEAEARRKKRGFWKEMRDDQQPDWRKAWLKSLREREE